MEVRNFIDTQLNPLVVVVSYDGVSEIFPVATNSVIGSGLWQYDLNDDPVIPNLMAIDVMFGEDINEMSTDELMKRTTVSVICEIPTSFYNSDLSDGLPLELISVIQGQLLSFFELINVTFTIADGQKVNPLTKMREEGWSFRISHGITIRPSITEKGNLGFSVHV